MSTDSKSAAPGGDKQQKPRKQQNPIVRLYLVLFNVTSMLLWAVTMFFVVQHLFVRNGTAATLYAADVRVPGSGAAVPGVANVGELLAVTQTLAVMEVVHSLVGAVSSPVATVAMQVASRLLLVWGITVPVAASRLHWGYAMMVLSWCAVEIPRYLYYVLNLIAPNNIPYVMTWLRYSLFAVLYPTGISGELSCIYMALEPIRASGMWSLAMPNAYNFAFSWYWACIVILALYAPGSPVMYKHMLIQRNKNLGAGTNDKANDKAKTN